MNRKAVLKLVKLVAMKLEDNVGMLICSRVQMPLLLAYALTVHQWDHSEWPAWKSLSLC